MPTEPVMLTETDPEGNEATYEITTESGDDALADIVVTAASDSDGDGEVDTLALDAYFVYPEELKSVARVQVFRDFLVANAQRWKF